MKASGRNKLSLIAAAFLLTCFQSLCAEEVRIAVAANFKPALDELAPLFESETGHKPVISTGSTGTLYAQIINGAPYDIFLAADDDRPALLIEKGAAVQGSRFTYAIGQLVLWSPQHEVTGPSSLNTQAIAIAHPDLAPYGHAAMSVLNALELPESDFPKLIRGENVGQAFTFVQSSNVEYGFVSLSQVLTLPEGKRGSWWGPPSSFYTPIEQDAVLLSRGANNVAAIEFHAYLQSDLAKELITQHGYIIP